jgi:exosome complex component RRP42
VSVLLTAWNSCPSASPEFEGRGAEELNIELARVIERVLTAPSALDMKSLCLIPGKQCWVLYIDVMVLDSAGNLFDAISIAVRAALATTTFVLFVNSQDTDFDPALIDTLRIPKVNVIEKPGGQYELELSDDADETVRLNTEDVPICVTFTELGGFEIIDATMEEELCLGCRTTLAINKKGLFCTVQKGFGTISVTSLKSMIKIGRRVALQILEKLDDTLAKEQKERRQKIGFFM